MKTNGGLRGLVSILLVVALIVFWTRPRQTTVYVVEAVDASLLVRAVIEGYTREAEEMMRAALLAKLTRRCSEAFNNAGLRSPEEQLRESGLVIRPSKYLYDYSARYLGLASEEIRKKYKDDFSTGRAQGGTVPHIRSGKVRTLDGRAHIYLHDSAFLGDTFLAIFFSWFEFEDVLTHELIHAGGQPPTPGFFGSIRHDLAGFEHYDAIISACR